MALFRIGGNIRDDAGKRAIALVVCLVVAACVPIGNFFFSPRVVRSVMIENELCASCGQNLRGLTPSNSDGCVRCPSCRASWLTAPSSENS